MAFGIKTRDANGNVTFNGSRRTLRVIVSDTIYPPFNSIYNIGEFGPDNAAAYLANIYGEGAEYAPLLSDHALIKLNDGYVEVTFNPSPPLTDSSGTFVPQAPSYLKLLVVATK